MLTKIIPPGSYDLGDRIAEIVRLSRSGPAAHDKRAFQKRAAADILHNLDAVRDQLHRGEELIHLYALGTTEKFGANRNGDGFKAAACRKYHDTFVKHAKFFRNHDNKANSPHYGRIIKSAFNDPMGRVELLVALFGTKEAADRFGGHLADKELDALGSGKNISVSMACGLERDFCSYCDNAAPRAADYCRGIHEGGRCKAGGLRNNMGSLVEVDGDLHHLHADNRDPKFFDISNVWRPADRIAYITGSLQKAAGERGVVKSADLARMLGVTIPVSLLIEQAGNPRTAAAVKVAYQLADIESDIARGILPLSTMSLAAMSPQMQCDEGFTTPPGGREKFSSVLRALVDARVCLPLPYFVEYVTGVSKEKAAAVAAVVANDLPGIFSDLVSSGELVERLENNPYTPAEHTNLKHAVWARQQTPACGVDQSSVQRRVDLAAIRNFTPTLRDPLSREKIAADVASRRLATEYALYKIAFLNAIPQMSSDFVLTASLLTLQNHAA